MSDGFYELFRLIRIIKDIFTARNAAIHVVGGSGDKEARLSRHGMPPMRGRDNPILLSRRHKSTMSQCDLWHPSIQLDMTGPDGLSLDDYLIEFNDSVYGEHPEGWDRVREAILARRQR